MQGYKVVSLKNSIILLKCFVSFFMCGFNRTNGHLAWEEFGDLVKSLDSSSCS